MEEIEVGGRCLILYIVISIKLRIRFYDQREI